MEEKASRILDAAHWTIPNHKQRLTTKQWRSILLEDLDAIIFKGHIRPLRAQSLGHGIVEVQKDMGTKDCPNCHGTGRVEDAPDNEPADGRTF